MAIFPYSVIISSRHASISSSETNSSSLSNDIFFSLRSLKYFSSDVASTLALLSLVMQEIIYAFSCRNLKKYIFKEGIFSNKAFNIGISILLIIEALIFLTPIGNIINVVVVDIKAILLVILFNLLAFIIYEISKVKVAKIFKD